MDERAQAALDALLSAKNLRDVCPETVRRGVRELLPRYRKPKDAEKAARTHLHQITGAFMTADAQEKARALLSRWNEGDESALAAALSLHASTRERLPGADEWMRRVSPFLGEDARVLDLACGLNPILLGSMGVTNALGMDIHLGCVRLVNETARARGCFPVSDELAYLANQAAASRGFTSKHSGQRRLSAVLSRDGRISRVART